MRFILFLPLFCFFLTACGGATNPDYAPSDLANTKIQFTINTMSSSDVPDNTYTKNGVSTSQFDTKNFTSDFSDLASGYAGGTYTFSKNEANKVTINQDVIGGYSIVTQMTFSNKTKGTFVTNILLPGLTFKQEGTFIFSHETFRILPTDLNNQNFNLAVQKIDNTQPELADIKTAQSITTTFSGGRQTFLSPDGKILTNPSYSLNEVNKYELAISGKFLELGKPNVLHLTFNSAVTGTFSMDLGDNKNVVSGNFNSIKFTSIDTSVPLKGTTLTGKYITSAITQITYPYTIYLPEGYEHSTKTYPVVYVTDGQWNNDFSFLLEQHHKDMIMVAIAQGPNERRAVDFVPPGSTNYIKFLKTELIPLIEQNYRHNGNRTFFGASLGGLLGAALVAEESEVKPFFKNYLLIDGSFWGLTPEIVAMEEAHASLPIRLLLTHTRKGNGLWVDQYAERVTARHYNQLFVVNTAYDLLTHEEMAPVGFADLIDLIDDTPQ